MHRKTLGDITGETCEFDDGNVDILKSVMQRFRENLTEQDFISVLEVLKESVILIPCNAIVSDADYAEIERAVKEAEAGAGPESLIGQEFSNRDFIRFIPDVLQNNSGELFLPVFSKEEEMGEYGEQFSKVECGFSEAVSLAQHNENKLNGIVINPFTESFVLTEDLFDTMIK